jgi:ketosteroid isomerase-like protein
LKEASAVYARVGVIGLVALAVAAPAVVGAAEDATQELVRIERAWRKARVNGDIPFLERLYAKELRILGTDGSVIERDTDISLFASGKVRPEFIEAEDLRVSHYRDVAVVTGVDHLKGTYNGVQGEGRVRFTHVFVRRDGRWQLVASQGTWIPKAKSPQ